MIQLRDYTPDDYPTMQAWWQGHDFAPVPAALLPATGKVAARDGVPVAAAWLYIDSTTGVAMLEWIVTDPGNPARLSAVAIGHLLVVLQAAAQAMGCPAVLASCRQDSLAKLMERTGFARTDEGMIHLATILN